MGQAKQRKAKQNHRTGADFLVVRMSQLTGKWAVDLDLPNMQSIRLTVYNDLVRAAYDKDRLAAPFLGQHSAKALASSPLLLNKVLQDYFEFCASAGIDDDDECVAVLKPMPDGSVVRDIRTSTRRAGNASLREHGILSDGIWHGEQGVSDLCA